MKKAWTISALTAFLCAGAPTAWGATVDELQQQIETLGKEVQTLKESGAGKGGSGREEESYLKKTWDKTRFGGYGELDYVFRRENGNGQGENSFEPRRFVLYVNSELAEWVTLNSELEWEHGGVPDGGPDAGVSVEQAFLDFKLSRPLNVKAGVMLMPVGATNLYHEPTSFNATTRPEPDQIIIPTTWQEMGIGIHGVLGDRADYQLLVTTGLDGTKFSAESGIPEAIPLEMCYLGWQESLAQLATLVEPDIPG